MSVAKPASLATWDSGSVNLIAPGGGHQANGWALSEVPTSTEMNGWQQIVGLWTKFENALFTDGGGAIGVQDVGNTAEAALVPLQKYRDFLSNTRSLVDHNGYRMGQVSEIDEHWATEPQTFMYPIVAGLPQSGTWTNTGNWSQTASGQIYFSLGELVPEGAIITNIVFQYNRTTAGDSQTFILQSFTNGTPTILASKTIAAGTGVSSTDLASSPTAGTLPRVITTTPNDYVLAISSTITTSFNLYGIRITYIMPPKGWAWTGITTNLSTGATLGDKFTVVDPQSGLNHRGINLSSTVVSATAGGSLMAPGSPSTSGWETFIDDTSSYVLEFMIRTGVITDGSAHRLFKFGIQHNHAGSTDWFATLYTDNTFANWQFQIIDGAGTSNNDTGVAVAANTVYRVRLEVQGGLVSSAGTGKALMRCSINGTTVSLTSLTFTNDKIRPYFLVGTNGTTGGPYDCTIGRVRRCWNHRQSGDNL